MSKRGSGLCSRARVRTPSITIVIRWWFITRCRCRFWRRLCISSLCTTSRPTIKANKSQGHTWCLTMATKRPGVKRRLNALLNRSYDGDPSWSSSNLRSVEQQVRPPPKSLLRYHIRSQLPAIRWWWSAQNCIDKALHHCLQNPQVTPRILYSLLFTALLNRGAGDNSYYHPANCQERDDNTFSTAKGQERDDNSIL